MALKDAFTIRLHHFTEKKHADHRCTLPLFYCFTNQKYIIMRILIYVCLFFFNTVNPDYPGQQNDKLVASGKVFKSIDNGQTWQDVSAGLPLDFQAWSVFADEKKVYLGYDKGIYLSSTDSDVPKWEKDIYMVENTGGFYKGKSGAYAHSYNNGFYQKMPLTGVWIRLFTNMKEKALHVILEADQGNILVGSDDGIYKSTDNGKSWKHVFVDDMITRLVAKDGIMIAGGSKGLLRSSDGGDHWQWVLTEEGYIKQTEIINGDFVAVTYGHNPDQPAMLNPSGVINRLRSSSDGGKTWTYMDKHLSTINNIADIKQADKYLFCSLDTGIFRSSDMGMTWALVLPTTKKDVLYNLTISGNVMYAIKVFGGC